MLALDDSAAVECILEALLPVTIAFAKAQVEAGADVILLGDHATRDLCGPALYEKFLRPAHARLASEIPVPVILHICGDTRDRLALIAQTHVAALTPPPFFAKHIAPWLLRFSRMLHARGKYLMTHADGENTGLLELYGQCGIDVADSICPSPMTQLTFAQTRQAFEGKGITIMGGIPSVALLPSAMNEACFAAFLDRFLGEIGRGDHLILGISDSTPPGADFDRLRQIACRMADFPGGIASDVP